jgi:hypothetical protein
VDAEREIVKVTTDKKIGTRTKKYAPLSSERSLATDKKADAMTATKSAATPEIPALFFARITKRRDVDSILRRLAKD